MRVRTLTINLAGIAVRFDSRTPLPPFPGIDAGSFLDIIKKPDIRFSLRGAKPGRSLLSHVVPGLKHCRLLGNVSRFLEAEPVRRRLDKVLMHPRSCAVELSDRSVSIYDFRRNRADFFYDVFEIPDFPARRVDFGLAAMFLPAFSALILHTAGIVRNGRAVLLAAPDGGGKSTAAFMASRAGSTILNDDRTAVRRVRGRWHAFGTPWGRAGARASAPLAGVFFLEKSRRFGIEPVSPTDAMHFLWEDNRDMFHPMPTDIWIQAAALFHGLCRRIPAFRLQFPLDGIDWKTVFGAVESARVGIESDFS